jgi:hypothetical protein
VRYCPSCLGQERTRAIDGLRALVRNQGWSAQQRSALESLKLALIGNATAAPRQNMDGDPNATCKWDCYRRATMLEPLAWDVLARGVPSDFLEAGVYRGGIATHLAALLAVRGALGNSAPRRRMWLCDSFRGMPERTSYASDWAARRRAAGERTELAEALMARDRDARGLARGVFRTSAEQVAHNVAAHLAELQRSHGRSLVLEDSVSPSTWACDFESDGLATCGVHLVPGFFAASLPGPVGALALLRIDADLYTSIYECLTALYPRLSAGGYVIFVRALMARTRRPALALTAHAEDALVTTRRRTLIHPLTVRCRALIHRVSLPLTVRCRSSTVHTSAGRLQDQPGACGDPRLPCGAQHHGARALGQPVRRPRLALLHARPHRLLAEGARRTRCDGGRAHTLAGEAGGARAQ